MKQRLYILMMLAVLFCGKAWADSGLYLFGQEVSTTSDWTYMYGVNNLNNAMMSGYVSYDASEKTLLFYNTNAIVTGDNRILYNKNVPGLKILFSGSVTLTSNYCVFRFDVDTEIQGSSDELVHLKASGDNTQCIYCPNETNLTIRDFAKLKMTSMRWRALHTKATNVYIYNSNIYMEGADCAIQNDKGNPDEWEGHGSRFVLYDCLIRDSWAELFGSVGEGYVHGSFGLEIFGVHTSKAKSVMIIRSEDYLGVRLKGIALTKGWSINTDTSNPSYGIEDYYTYNASTNTLTLKKDIQAKTGYGDKMKSNLNDWIGIRIGKPITINGDGHYAYGQQGMSCFADATLNNITIAGTEDGIYIDDCDLTLKDDIIIGGVESAIANPRHADGSYHGTIKFNPSLQKTIMLVPCNDKFRETTSFEERPINGYGATLENCIITTPEGAEMRSNGPVLNDEYVKTKVVITGYATYDLWVRETQVTSLNASDILGDGGHFKYDAATNTLIVNNATLEDTDYNRAIYNDIDGLNINFVGASTFTTERSTIDSNKSINLTGSGSLKATVSRTHCCIDLFGKDDIICNINGPQLDLTADSYVIYDHNKTSTLNVTGSSTRLALHPASGKQAIFYLKALNLGDGLYISEPVGGYFDPSLRSITVDGRLSYKGDVVIEKEPKKLGFSINGTEMTTLNINNVPGVVSGNAYITLNSNDEPTLVLENATLECDGKTGVNNGHYGSTFNIKVIGDCTITGKGVLFNPLYLDSETSTTIKGGGTLNLISANEDGKAGDAIYSGMEARLTLTDYTTVIAKSIDNSGYCDEGEGRFTIDSGYFCAYSEKWYPVWLPSQFLLGTGIECRYPVGGQAWGNYVYDANGAPVQGDWVMFGYDTQVMDELITGVDNVNANLNPNEGIFNLAGQRLSKMQKGINIVGGKKVLVK